MQTHSDFSSFVNSKAYSACTAIFAVLVLLSSSSYAQPDAYISHSISSKTHDPSQTGRDFSFALCQNFRPGAAIGVTSYLYVTSQKATTIRVSLAGASIKVFSLNANQVLTYQIPLTWQMNTSGVVENKGIRVWSEDADLSAYVLSLDPGSQEGMTLIPTTGWGPNYVVAGYGGIFEASFDYPSEFSVVTNQNTTELAITPSTDIRSNQADTVILHARAQQFSEFLNQGQCAQYLGMQAVNCTDFDLTGSIVTSNVPIGIEGASIFPNIPCDYGYGGFVCEQDQPMRTWSNAYLTIPLSAGRNDNGDTFLAIPSYDGQIIYQDDLTSGTNHVFCSGLPKFTPFWFDAVSTASNFHSDSAFELVQFKNSKTWSLDSLGGPAMTTVPGIREYSASLQFIVPSSASLPFSFTYYLNLICPKGSRSHTRIDGKTLSSTPGIIAVAFSDPNWEGYILSSLTPGAHVIQSDSVGSVVGVYGYGFDGIHGFAWPFQVGVSTVGSTDSLAPIATATTSCLCAHVAIHDPLSATSGINSVKLDTINNFIFDQDPNYIAGMGVDSTFYDICVLDSTKNAFMQVSAFDLAGNHTTITSSYLSRAIIASPQLVDFGTVSNSQSANDTIVVVNVGATPFHISTLTLRLGNDGFSIVGNPSDTIAVGDFIKVVIKFRPVVRQTLADTLVITDGCTTRLVFLTGNGGSANFDASNDNFGCDTLGRTVRDTIVTLDNTSISALTIDSVWVGDTAHFHFLGASLLPLTLPAKTLSITKLPFSFTPSGSDLTFATRAFFLDKQDGLLRSDSLFGCGLIPASVASNYSNQTSSISDWLSGKDGSPILLLPVHPNPTSGNNTEVTFTIGLRKSGALSLKLYDLLGREQSVVLDSHNQPQGISDIHFDTNLTPTGTYVYRLEALGEIRTGQLMIQR